MATTTRINLRIFDTFPDLASERLRYRQFVAEDAAELFRLRSDERVMEWMDTDRHRSIRDAEELVERNRALFEEKEGVAWAIVEKQSDRFIGYIQQPPDSPTLHKLQTTNHRLSMPINPLSDGPLLVSDLADLRDAEGNRVEPNNEPYALCRCGASKNKPFCDGTHKEIDYSGARETDRENDRYKAYDGEKVSVQDNRTICAHAQLCIKDLPEVFKSDERPWIRPDEGQVDEIVALTKKCPSGALVAMIDGKRADDPVEAASITIVTDGPYNVVGPVPVESDDAPQPPVADRYSLCRCGASKNKPYCDGSHLKLDEGWGELNRG